jgi:chromosome segregation ATPase
MINKLRAIKTNLAYIHANFSFLSQTITKLKKNTNLLSETIKEINDKLNKIKSLEDDAVKQKFNSCCSKNKEFKVMCKISCVINRRDLGGYEDLKDLNVSTSLVIGMQVQYHVM